MGGKSLQRIVTEFGISEEGLPSYQKVPAKILEIRYEFDKIVGKRGHPFVKIDELSEKLRKIPSLVQDK